MSSSDPTTTTTKKTVVVTGGNRGLGLEMVKQLSERENVGKVYALCRKTSESLSALSKGSAEGKIVVVEDMDVSSDDVIPKLRSYFRSGDGEGDGDGDGEDKAPPIAVDMLIHNAGAFGPPTSGGGIAELMATQSLTGVTMDTMRFTFEINTMGPLRTTQALLPNLRTTSPSADDPAKVIIITSLVGSLSDNTSGGIYAYRASKAGVNMVGKSLSVDLKKENVAVGLIHPGMVQTGFGGMGDGHKMPGTRDVEPSTKGVLEAIDATTLENTGCFLHGNYGEGVKPLSW